MNDLNPFSCSQLTKIYLYLIDGKMLKIVINCCSMSRILIKYPNIYFPLTYRGLPCNAKQTRFKHLF